MKTLLRFYAKLFFLTMLSLSLKEDTLTAQSRLMDSLRNLLNHQKEDTATVYNLYYYASFFYNSNKDSALWYNNKGLVLSKKINYVFGEGMGFNAQADIISEQGNTSKALELYFKALQIFETLDRKAFICRCLISISSLYDDLLNDRKALEYSKRAYTIAKSANLNTELTAAAWDNGYYYAMMNMPDSALPYFQESYALAMKETDYDYKDAFLGEALSGIGLANYKMGNTDIALPYLYKAIDYLVRSDNDYYLAYNYGFMAELFRTENKPDSSVFYYMKELDMANKLNYVRVKLDVYEGLSKMYQNTDPAKAIEYFKLQKVLNDSLYSADKNWEIQNLTANEEERQKEKQAKAEQEIKEHKTNIQYAAIVIGIITLIILFLLLSRSIIVNEKVVKFLSIFNLLVFFEFINLLLASYIEHLTNHTPILMLLILVAIAALIIPLHHSIEHFITEKMIEKNKKVRLAAAKRIVAKLESKE